MVTRHSLRIGPQAALAAAALAVGCTLPKFEGPQVQDPPRGFLLQNDSVQERRMFPERETSMHIAWVRNTDGVRSGIYINAHPGNLSIEEAMTARESALRAARHPQVTFGEVEPLTIDGRPAWGWPERLETPERGLDWVAYRTVVSYDTISYAIEFFTDDPRIKPNAPDTLKAVLATFAIGRTEWNLPLMAVLIGLTLMGVSVLRGRQQERAKRLANINLVKIEKDPDPSAGPE